MGFDQTMIDRLLESARRKNDKHEVTGMLCFDGEYFIQILEGDVHVVEELYNQICEDPRHSNIRQIYSGNIVERNFRDWSMGYQFMSPLTGEIVEKAWKDCEDALKTPGKIETRGITFFKYLKKTQLSSSLNQWG